MTEEIIEQKEMLNDLYTIWFRLTHFKEKINGTWFSSDVEAVEIKFGKYYKLKIGLSHFSEFVQYVNDFHAKLKRRGKL